MKRYVLYIACIFILSASATTAAGHDSSDRHIQLAMARYGWSIPICLWPEALEKLPNCLTVATLIRYFPYRANVISAELRAAVASNYRNQRQRFHASERVMAKLDSLGTIGCVPRGENKGIISVGLKMPSEWDPQARTTAFKNACQKTTPPTIAETLDQLGNPSSTTPPSLPGMDSYKKYYDQCKIREQGARTRTPLPTVDGKKTETEEEKKARLAVEAAKKKKADKKKELEDAVEKKKDAEEEKREAQKKLDDAKAQGAPQSQIDDLQKDVDAADQKLADANFAIDNAAQGLAAAIADHNRTVTDYAKALRLPPYGPKATDNIVAYAWYMSVRAVWNFVFFDPILLPDPFEDCIAAECEITDCHTEATVKILRDELYKFKRPRCVGGRGPEDGTCHGPVLGAPIDAATIKRLQELTCKERKKYMADEFAGESCQMFIESGEWAFDPCDGPEVMCAPEDGFTGSIPIPVGGDGGVRPGVGSGSTSPHMWVNQR